MTAVTVTIDTFVDQTFPEGTVAGDFNYVITKADGTPVGAQISSAATATFNIADPGDYVASAQRLNGAGSPLGTAVTQPFTISAASVSILVPSHITVAL